ncbi:MAG: PD-(D/E)XK nuclease family protein [Oscillospiraceae bacterium]|jgi:ATP-dependent helicase/nuclease subunit B|nr:PD-(D/E)XK nuclease family protein [Oscillospiraceae bacterium]
MIRIIIGRAGAGKTARIMTEIAELTEKRERSVLIVPEQYSHSAERHLLKFAGDKLSMYGDVLSFRRLVLRVSEEFGVGGKTLDAGGMLLTLHRTMTALSGKLELYNGADMRVKFLNSLLTTITELQSGAITPEILRNASAEAPDALGKKLRDLALILAAFEAHLPEGYTDAGGEMIRLAEYIAGSEYARHRMFFDGFSDFTEPESRIIKALITVGADMTLCLSLPDADNDDAEFRVCADTVRELRKMAEDCGEQCEVVTVNAEDNPPARELYAAPDTIAECEYAAVKVLEFIKEGYRYGDIAVFSRGGGYPELCERVFERYGIPTFRSGRDDILEKPPVRLIINALEIAADPRERDKIFYYLRTGLAGFTDAEIDAFENRVLANGTRGEVLIGSGEPFTAPLKGLQRSLKAANSCGEMLRGLYAFLEEIALPKTLAERAEELRALGETRLADEYEQLWNIIIHALDDMYAAISDAPIDVTEFAHTLKLLLSQCDVGVIPTALDRVTLGDMAMSRRRELKALIVLGCTDANMPGRAEKAGVLSAAERSEVIENLGVPLRDTSEKLLYREMNTIYAALSLPSEQLVLIYPESANPSFIVGDEPPHRMSEARRRSASEAAALLRAWENPTTRGSLSTDGAKKLYGEVISLSATRVERFFSCKYAFFLESGLRIRPRRIGGFDAPDAGSFTHYVLQKMTEQRQNGADIRELCRRAAEEYIATEIPAFEQQTQRFRYLLRRLSRGAENIAVDLAEELDVSEFSTLGFEMPFSAKPDGGFEVRGQIDRVDVWADAGTRYLRVADYKTGRKKEFSLSDALYGLNLQMLIYLYALGGKIDNAAPAAALYTPARDEILSEKYNLPDGELAAELMKKARRSGLILDDERVADALEVGEKKRFLPGGDAVVSAERFALLTRNVETQLRDAAVTVRGGDITARPYYKSETENACRFCDYRAVCAHGTEARDEIKRLRKLTAAEVWRKLEEGGGAL